VTTEVRGEWVNDVLRVVVLAEPTNGDVQLSILTLALVRAGKIMGVSKGMLVDNLEAVYDFDLKETMQ
jgi:hypothetical protein